MVDHAGAHIVMPVVTSTLNCLLSEQLYFDIIYCGCLLLRFSEDLCKICLPSMWSIIM